MGKETLFSKIRIRTLELSNRIVMAPMAIHLAPMTGELNLYKICAAYFFDDEEEK